MKGGAILKRLICAEAVKAAAARGEKTFLFDGKTIITPAARDAARELGIEFSEGSSCVAEGKSAKADLNQAKGAIDKDLIYQVVKAVLANRCSEGEQIPAFLAEGDPQNGLKIVRGRSVSLENFDTGNPKDKVAYREVVSKDEAKMSAGFLTIEDSCFDWELCYEEIDIILDGCLAIEMDGKTHYAYQGDVIFIPNGSKVRFSAGGPGHVKLFYVTYPANWPDLIG